jgi:hypothetical protein
MKTNAARVLRADAAMAPPVPAQIIPFPVPARAVAVAPAPAVAPRTSVRPSLGVNIVLALILMLACLLWEVMSIPSSALVDAGHTAITSPRASLGDGSVSTPRDLA